MSAMLRCSICTVMLITSAHGAPGAAASYSKFSPPSCWGGDLFVNRHEISLILYFTYQVLVWGFKWEKSLCSEGRRGTCVSVPLQCVIALCWSLSLPTGSGCMWDLMAAYQLTTHMSLWRGCSSLLTEMLWNVAYEKSKPKCFCNSMWGRTNVGVHENIPASLLTREGREGGGSFCAFVKRVKLSPPGSGNFWSGWQNLIFFFIATIFWKWPFCYCLV